MDGLCDIHCHIIYDVDDGAATPEDSIGLIKEEYKQGVRSIVFTPHFRKGMFECDSETVLRHYNRIKSEAEKECPEMDLHIGCELHFFSEALDKFKSNPYMRMAGSDYVLLEFSELDDNTRIINGVNTFRMAGYKPIIAHIERYGGLEISDIFRLYDSGAFIQVNADSVIGLEDRITTKLVRTMLSEGIVSFVGSDAHDLKERVPHIDKSYKFISKKYGKEYADEIFITNPKIVINEGRNKNAGR